MKAALNMLAVVIDLSTDVSLAVVKSTAPKAAGVVNALTALVKECQAALPHSDLPAALERATHAARVAEAERVPYEAAIQGARSNLRRALRDLKASLDAGREPEDKAWHRYARKSVGY